MSTDQIRLILSQLNAIETTMGENRRLILEAKTEAEQAKLQFAEHRKMACEHWKSNKEFQKEILAFQEELRPVIDAQRWLVLTNRGIKWIGGTILGTVAFLWWFMHRT